MNKCDCGGEAVSLPHYEWCSSLAPAESAKINNNIADYEYFVIYNASARNLGARNAFFAKKMDEAFIGPIANTFNGCNVFLVSGRPGEMRASCRHANAYNRFVAEYGGDAIEGALQRMYTEVKVKCPSGDGCDLMFQVDVEDWDKFKDSLNHTVYRSRTDVPTQHFVFDHDTDAFVCWCGELLPCGVDDYPAPSMVDPEIAAWMSVHATCPKP